MEELDRLAADFAARDHEPDGAALDGDGHGDHGQHAHGEGVRRFEYRGHQVEIATSYEVTIDGEPWGGHVEALNDGTVAYHGLPQYAVPSAVDLIRTVIDYEEDAPEDLRTAFRAAQEEE
jgi:hypothetical protein